MEEDSHPAGYIQVTAQPLSYVQIISLYITRSLRLLSLFNCLFVYMYVCLCQLMCTSWLQMHTQ